MGRRNVSDEQLSAAGVLARLGHTHRAPLVPLAIDLVSQQVTRAPPSVSPRVSSLDHEVRDDPVPQQTVVVPLPYQVDETGDVDRSFLRETTQP